MKTAVLYQIFPNTDKSLSAIYFSEEDILKIIISVKPNKTHGHDNISTPLIKLCDKEICKPLHIIFVSCMEEGIFPLLWKMANVVPGIKEKIKIIECLLYNQIHSFFIENNLMFLNHSGFRQGGSCINQLISINHEFYRSMD